LQSRSNIILLIISILAFVPILISNYVLDGYFAKRETAILSSSANEVSSDMQSAVYEGIDLIQDVLGAAPSLCTPSFLNNLYSSMQISSYVRQVVVENQFGVRYCEALGGNAVYDVLSEELPIPGRVETIAAVRMPGQDMPGLRVTYQIDDNKRISAFIALSGILPADGLPHGFADSSLLRLVFADGTELLSIGDSLVFDEIAGYGDNGKFLHVVSLAGDVPLRLEVALSFSKARQKFADIYIWIILIACAFSASILVGSLQIIKKSSLPSFDLEYAIANGEICPFYQPVMDISTGRLYGCEVLARWVKPNGEIISPGAFIEYAEISGLAIPMTISIMETVRGDLEQISAQNPDLKISINLFEGHFRDGSVVEDVEAIFGDSAIDFRQLVFEITERHPLGDNMQANSVISGLQAMGCKLAMDDVGTGHSNLAYIQTLGIDIIKIDKVFVDPITKETTSMPILDNLIALAQDLNAGIIAEGVETAEQALYLRSKGVKNIQGFLFSPAIKAEKYLSMVRALNGTGQNAIEDNQTFNDSKAAA